MLIGLCTVIDLISLQADAYFCNWSCIFTHTVGTQQMQASQGTLLV